MRSARERDRRATPIDPDHEFLRGRLRVANAEEAPLDVLVGRRRGHGPSYTIRTAPSPIPARLAFASSIATRSGRPTGMGRKSHAHTTRVLLALRSSSATMWLQPMFEGGSGYYRPAREESGHGHEEGKTNSRPGADACRTDCDVRLGPTGSATRHQEPRRYLDRLRVTNEGLERPAPGRSPAGRFVHE